MRITFDYNTNTILIEDGVKKDKFRSTDYKRRFGAQWPLLTLNILLKDYYKYYLNKEETGYLEVAEALYDEGYKLSGDIHDNVSRAVGYLNAIVLANTDLIIKRHSTQRGFYLVEPKSDNLLLEWIALAEDYYTINQYGIKNLSDWSSDEPIEFGESYDSPGKIANKLLKVEMSSDKHKGESIKPAVLWNDIIIKNVVDNLSGHYISIEKKLMPGIRLNGKLNPYTNLSTFIIDEYIDRTKYPNRNTFALLEGDEGTGKSYSLYYTAKKLCDANHVAIVASLEDIYSDDGTHSLLSYICQYMQGSNALSSIQRVKNLCKKASDRQKVFIIIDSLDEVFPGYYKQIGADITTILDVDNPNVYVLLAGRDGSAFIENSGIQNTACINMYCENLSKSVLREEESDLAWIMDNYPNTCTPLFINYFRETKALYDDLKKNSSRTKNLSLYGDVIDLRKINNYYDLYTARTSMLCAHAYKDTGSASIFSDILPSLAYKMYESKSRQFNKEVVQEIDHYLFEDASIEERISSLISTGIVRRTAADNTYSFAHYDYMQFLAAKHAAEIVSFGNEDYRYAVLAEAVNRSSYYEEADDDETVRLDKMRFIPYCYYLCMDVVHGNKNVYDNLQGEPAREETFDYTKFDPLFFQLGANVVYEGRDLWSELKELTDNYLKDQKGHIIGKKTRKIKHDEWELIDAINVISYTMNTKKVSDPVEKWNMLHSIQSNLNDCAGIILDDIYKRIGREGDYQSFVTNAGKRWDDKFCRLAMIDLIEYIKTNSGVDYTVWKYPVDLLGRIYGNLGAVLLEKARYGRAHIADLPDNVKPEELLDNAEKYHSLAKDYRETIVAMMPELRQEISLIRSNIAMGSDMFYRGLFDLNPKTAIESFEKAVTPFYEKALKLQGLGIEEADGYSLDMELPIKRTGEIVEQPSIGAEPIVIWPRIAGCYYMCYQTAKKEGKLCSKSDVVDLINKQYVALKASYLFVLEDCIDNKDTGELNQTKLEINTDEIDKLWKDVKDKFVNSFSDPCCDNKDAKYDLLNKVRDLYKALHKYTEVEKIEMKTNGVFELVPEKGRR